MIAPNPAAARRDAEEALRPVSDDEAQEILSRFIASHFRKHDREHARFRIPADPEHDDDLRMSQYIRETRALRALLAERAQGETRLSHHPLAQYVRHHPTCAQPTRGDRCDCGLDRLMTGEAALASRPAQADAVATGEVAR